MLEGRGDAITVFCPHMSPYLFSLKAQDVILLPKAILVHAGVFSSVAAL